MKNKTNKTKSEPAPEVDMSTLNEKITSLVESFETQVSELKAQLDGRLDSQDELVTEAAAEVEAQKSELNTFIESVKTMGDNNKDVKKLEDEVKTLKEEHEASIKSLKARIDKAEAKSSAPGAASGSEDSEIGAFFKSEQYKNWQAEGFSPRSAPGKLNMAPVLGYKATGPIVLAADELSAAAPPVYRPGIVDIAQEELGLFGAVTRGPQITGEVYHAARETPASAYGFIATTTASGLDGDPTEKNTIAINDPVGFVDGAYVRFHAASGVERKAVVSVDTTNNWLVFAADDLDFDAASGTVVTSEVYGATAEEGTKPAGMVEVEDVSETLKVLATYMTISKQRLAATPGMASWLEMKLRDRFQRTLDWHLLYGDSSVAGELAGFFSDSDLVTVAWSDGEVDDNYADCLMRASQSIASSGSLTAVMHKQDWLKLLLAKDDNANYVHTNFGPMSVGSRSVGDIKIVLTDAIVPGSALLADLGRASEFVSNGMASLEWGYVGENFVKNLVTPLYEEMCAHIILDPFAFVKVSFDVAPS